MKSPPNHLAGKKQVLSFLRKLGFGAGIILFTGTLAYSILLVLMFNL